tara:strand:- start:1488 stop:1940 length:453 start_codon:yes stop_codon:yes gene_type:complete
MQIPDGFKLIPKTTHYAYYPVTNLVMNLKTERVLTPQWQGEALRTKVVDENGTPFYFVHDSIDKPPPPTLTREYVLQDEGARILPDYPRYAITELGVLYCIEPCKRGRKANRIHVVDTHDHQGWESASLVTPDGKTRKLRIDKTLKSVWG